MTLTLFIIKEYGRIILKKGYKEHSDLVRGVKLYRSVPKEKKKSLYKCAIVR